MNKPGLEYKEPETTEKRVQRYEVGAAQELRQAATHWEATTVAAFMDGEAAGWTKEAADMFFARAQHPYFVKDATRVSDRLRRMAARVTRLAERPIDGQITD